MDRKKAVNCIENIFLDNKLIHQISTNDKTEFIDGYVYVNNDLNKMLGLDIGKIEIQIKGRTNLKSKGIKIKRTFLDYCKTNIIPVVIFLVSIPVVIFLVSINENENIEGIYFKYIDEDFAKSIEDTCYIKFTDKDNITSYSLIENLRYIQNKHLSKVISKINNSKTYIKNENIYYIVNKIIRSVNGFLYTALNKYMESNFKNIQRFGIAYYVSNTNTISYSIIPIFQGSLYNDIIEVNDKKDMFRLRVLTIHTTYVEFTNEFSSKLIRSILKEIVIPSVLNIRLFSRLNKEVAKRSLIYYFNIVLNKEKNKLILEKDINSINYYSDEIKQKIISNETSYSRETIKSIVNSNLTLIENKLHKDISFFKQHEASPNFVFYSECSDNKFTIDVINGDYVIKNTKESIYYLLRELLSFKDDKIINMMECKQINGQFSSQQDVDNYGKIKYDCICNFGNLYLNIVPRQYIWNTIFNRESLKFSTGGAEYVQIYYSNKWTNCRDSQLENDLSYSLTKGLISIKSKVLKSATDLTLNSEPLVKEVYEEIVSMLFNIIDTEY